MTVSLQSVSTGRVGAGRLVTFVCLMTGACLACAVSVPPSGGPEDKTPPRVAASVPAGDSTGVEAESPIAITFSEDMTRARVERNVSVSPSIIIDKVRWNGRTLVIQPEEPLQRDTTYVVRVVPGYRDHHNVPGKARFEFAFATGATLDTARVEGVVYFKREPSARAMVRAFRLPQGEDFDPLASRPDREAVTGEDGSYRLEYLPHNDARFVLVAFIDLNGNGAPDVPGEASLVYPDTVLLTAAVPVLRGIDFKVIDPNEPATVSGTVSNETGIDSLLASVVLTAVADSTRAPQYLTCDPQGAYAFARVPAGAYLVRAFLDIRADSVWGSYDCGDSTAACTEPSVQTPDTLRVEPGARVMVPPLVLRGEESP